MFSVDENGNPLLQDIGNTHEIGFAPSGAPFTLGASAYGNYHIVGSGSGDFPEASIAYYNINTNNSAADYWVAGVNVGSDNGNGNYNFWNGANNVVAKIGQTGIIYGSSFSGSFAKLDLIRAGSGFNPYDFTVFDVNNRVLRDGNNVSVINFQANSSGDTSTHLTIDSNANQVTVNSARLVANGYVQSPTGSFDTVSATSYTGNGSQLTGITATVSTVPTSLIYDANLVIDPSTGNYFKCILAGDVTVSFSSGGTDGQEIQLMVVAAGAGSSLTLADIVPSSESTYTNPKALTSFLLYIIKAKWNNDIGNWMLLSVDGGYTGY